MFEKSTFIGLAITFFAGISFSLFSPAFNLATNDQWHTLKKGVPHLSVYTAFFYFSVSCFVVAIILSITFLYHPVLNLPKSSLKAYLRDWNGRGWALLAGLLCGFGNGLQFMGGQAAGYAAADAVQVSFTPLIFFSLHLHNFATGRKFFIQIPDSISYKKIEKSYLYNYFMITFGTTLSCTFIVFLTLNGILQLSKMEFKILSIEVT